MATVRCWLVCVPTTNFPAMKLSSFSHAVWGAVCCFVLSKIESEYTSSSSIRCLGDRIPNPGGQSDDEDMRRN